jgi:uncharacterized protein (DUF2147 family)
MLRKMFIILLTMFCVPAFGQIEKIAGHWVTVDDKSGIEKSIVYIYKATNGKYYGRIEKLLEDKYAGALCEPCKGEDYNKPVEGLIIVRDMVYQDEVLSGGSVLDPESGNIYHGTISYDIKTCKLKLRGSIDKHGIFGRNQFWIRKK